MRRILNKPPEKYKWLRLPVYNLILNDFLAFVEKIKNFFSKEIRRLLLTIGGFSD